MAGKATFKTLWVAIKKHQKYIIGLVTCVSTFFGGIGTTYWQYREFIDPIIAIPEKHIQLEKQMYATFDLLKEFETWGKGSIKKDRWQVQRQNNIITTVNTLHPGAAISMKTGIAQTPPEVEGVPEVNLKYLKQIKALKVEVAKLKRELMDNNDFRVPKGGNASKVLNENLSKKTEKKESKGIGIILPWNWF